MVHMRPFNTFEQKNLKFLVNHNVKFTQVEITQTGLKKSILDATTPMRAYFIENGIHNYEEQLQGTRSKQFKKTIILTSTGSRQTKTSFYRPMTKKGDPRMWIYRIHEYTKENDIYIMFWFDSILYTINITNVDIEKCYNSPIITPLQDVIKAIYNQSISVSNELLGKFQSVSGQWFKSEIAADTGIGRSIESFLGIEMNSEKTPDYKGIELKSHRDKRSTQKNVLFTQAPDWDISKLKSSKQIVERYGYENKNGLKTYHNTVQFGTPNSQTLFLNLNQPDDYLELQAQRDPVEDVAAWRLIKLHQRLQTKHRETFWIEVENELRDGDEYFRYKQIEHTRNPNIGQFDVLIEQKTITVDLLLARATGGDMYSFKIKKSGMPLLFPESTIYQI